MLVCISLKYQNIESYQELLYIEETRFTHSNCGLINGNIKNGENAGKLRKTLTQGEFLL